MTTPTGVVARLLAMAEEHERKGAALRLAAEELHGRKIESKRNGFHKTLASAIELRESERPERSEQEPATRLTIGREREQLLTAFLTEHPQPHRVADLMAMLATHGHTMSRDGVRHALQRIGGRIVRGTGHHARWQLMAPRVEPRKPPAREALTYTERKHASRDKAEKLATILKEAGKPLLTAELAAAAREVGITSLTGIFGYVRKGWLKRTGKSKGTFRYSFLQLPSAESAPAS